MRLQRWLLLSSFMVLVACQAPAPSTPTAVAPTVPAASKPAPSAAPSSSVPTAAPSVVVAAAPSVALAPTAVPPAASASRIEALNAGNTAFRSGDVKTAAGLYERVINTPAAPGEAAAVSAAITDFARFRGGVALLADGREDDARATFEQLRQRDPNAPLARLANQLYDQYGMTGSLRAACAQIQPQVVSQAGPTLTILQGLGVNVDAATLCSVP